MDGGFWANAYNFLMICENVDFDIFKIIFDTFTTNVIVLILIILQLNDWLTEINNSL